MSTHAQTRVLVIGDNPLENTNLKNALNAAGYKVSSTIDVNEAKELIAKNWPDLLIFSFYEVGQAEAAYRELIFVSAESTCELGESLLLCRANHEAKAFDLCMNGFFYLYLVERPLNSEYAVRMALHLLEQKLSSRSLVEKHAAEGRHTYKVMVVEDEDLQRKVIEKMLKTLGHAVSLATDGQQALDLLAQDPPLPHLILMDIRMPGMDGFEAITRIKQHETWQKVPIIILSSNRDIESVTTGIKKGAVDFIVKPVSQLILKKKLDSHLS